MNPTVLTAYTQRYAFLRNVAASKLHRHYRHLHIDRDQDVDEVMSDVALLLVRKSDQFRGTSPAEADRYLCVIVANAVHSHASARMSARNRRGYTDTGAPVPQSLDNYIDPKAVEPYYQMDQSERVAGLLSRVNALPDAYRDPIIATIRNPESSGTFLANDMSIPYNNFKTRLHRGRKELSRHETQ